MAKREVSETLALIAFNDIKTCRNIGAKGNKFTNFSGTITEALIYFLNVDISAKINLMLKEYECKMAQG